MSRRLRKLDNAELRVTGAKVIHPNQTKAARNNQINNYRQYKETKRYMLDVDMLSHGF